MSDARPGTTVRPASAGVERIYRHTLAVRVMHWVNAIALLILLMSGFQIFNAHPALYWGDRSDPDRALLSMRGAVTETGELRGVTTVLGRSFDTTGLFGASIGPFGQPENRGFPAWATIPGGRWLAMGRRWHFFFAWVFVLNGLAFALYALCSRHLSRDLIPWWKDLRGLGRSIVDHLLFRHPTGEAARHYNVLQKISYFTLIFIFGPLVVLAGMAMSPWLDAAFPWLLTMFDGRQSARTVHFVLAFAFVLFIFIHLFMVAVTGVWNNVRSMLTGWYDIKAGGSGDGA
ncbi:MAG: cytochrome b/b6 domain-containing protein [Chromatiales bacterium]